MNWNAIGASSEIVGANEWLALGSAVRDIRALPGITRYWAQLKPHMCERLRRIVEDE